MSFSHCLGRFKWHTQFRNSKFHFEKCYFLRRVVFTPCPSSKLNDHLLSPVCPPYAQLRMPYAMVMGTHLSRENADSNYFLSYVYIADFSENFCTLAKNKRRVGVP
jgi:hypothetical protein